MAILRLISRRLLSSIPLLFVVSALTFVPVSPVPGDPARTIVGQHATEAQYHAVRDQLGLNDSLPMQYWDRLKGVAPGDLGSSLVRTGAGVSEPGRGPSRDCTRVGVRLAQLPCRAQAFRVPAQGLRAARVARRVLRTGGCTADRCGCADNPRGRCPGRPAISPPIVGRLLADDPGAHVFRRGRLPALRRRAD
ncbi:hypothetical protein [Embleya scabrispora]|uniref:hypothetical protein n=1 Tax=Embleya scabrispora TaxID=159449 RepID=UPI003CCB9FBA